MSYIDYKSKEDLQDDTFKQIAALNWNCMIALGDKDVNTVIDALDVLYLTCWKKLGNDLKEDFEERLRALEASLYRLEGSGDEVSQARSGLFNQSRELYKEMSGALSDAGLLFRATVSSDQIGKREEY